MNLIRYSTYNWVIATFALIALFSGVVTAELIVFGDSNSDVGNLVLAGGLPPEFDDSPYYPGQASNGPVWVQHLAERLGFEPTEPSLAGGNNFAFQGATAAAVPGVEAPNVKQQVGQYLAGNLATIADDQHVIWGGANDGLVGLQAAEGNQFTASKTLAVAAANAIVDSIDRLVEAGAEKILVVNLPYLSDVPAMTNLDATTKFVVDLYTLSFNTTLENGLRQLERETGATIARLDLVELVREIQAAPADFGLTNLTDPALAVELDPQKPRYPMPILPFQVVENPNTHLWWDAVHVTETMHKAIAEAAEEALDAAPPTPSLFDLLCLLLGC